MSSPDGAISSPVNMEKSGPAAEVQYLNYSGKIPAIRPCRSRFSLYVSVENLTMNVLRSSGNNPLRKTLPRKWRLKANKKE